jgi:hypothetical protein
MDPYLPKLAFWSEIDRERERAFVEVDGQSQHNSDQSDFVCPRSLERGRRASEPGRSWIEAKQDAARRYHEAIGEIDVLTGCVDISKLRGEGRFFK